MRSHRGASWLLCAAVVLGFNTRAFPLAIDWDAADSAMNHGSDASVDDVNPCTFLWWCKFHTVGGVLGQKGVAGAESPIIQMTGAGGDIQVQWVRRANLVYVTNDAPVSADTWHLVAVTIDTSASPAVAIYVGDLTTRPVESTYSTAIDGNGVPSSNAVGSLLVGGRSQLIGGPTASPDWDVAFYALYNRVLSLSEIRSQWMWPHRLTDASEAVFCHYIHADLSGDPDTQPDWSGNGNHGAAATASIIMAAHVPLPPLLW